MDIKLTAVSDGRISADWKTRDARFHVWINHDADGWKIGDTIYKNPPLDSGPRAFATRYLDLNAKAHAATRAQIEKLATHSACCMLNAAYIRESNARLERDAKRRRVNAIAECVVSIRNASKDDIAAATLDMRPDVAAAVMALREA